MEPILRVIAVRELSFKYFYSEFWYFLYFDVVGLLNFMILILIVSLFIECIKIFITFNSFVYIE